MVYGQSRFQLESAKKVVNPRKSGALYSMPSNAKIFWKRNRIPEAVYLPDTKTVFMQEGRLHLLKDTLEGLDIKKRVYFKSQLDLENYFKPEYREFLRK